jgi:hypothetical protein
MVYRAWFTATPRSVTLSLRLPWIEALLAVCAAGAWSLFVVTGSASLWLAFLSGSFTLASLVTTTLWIRERRRVRRALDALNEAAVADPEPLVVDEGDDSPASIAKYWGLSLLFVLAVVLLYTSMLRMESNPRPAASPPAHTSIESPH